MWYFIVLVIGVAGGVYLDRKFGAKVEEFIKKIFGKKE